MKRPRRDWRLNYRGDRAGTYNPGSILRNAFAFLAKNSLRVFNYKESLSVTLTSAFSRFPSKSELFFSKEELLVLMVFLVSFEVCSSLYKISRKVSMPVLV